MQFYGPDLGNYGIFNWNNSFGFMHELLNQYTNVFTTAENPLSAFATATRRLYIASDSPVSFCSTETFTRVWFAFISLQGLESGMKCPICGPHPDIVIADGVSIGYSVTKQKAGLLPPSMVTDQSVKVLSVNLKFSRNVISNASFRKYIRDFTSTKVPPAILDVSVNQRESFSVIIELLEFYMQLYDTKKLSPIRELLRQVK